nr:hypothetical protein CFP56_03089 [Quercus suber]
MVVSRRDIVPETAILKPLPLDDDDDLQLCDCRVLDTNTKQPISLLTAATFNAVTVIGTLNPLPKDKWHHYTNPEHRNKTHHIEITNVTRNAFGEYDDGSFGLWAAGQTGWYDIKGAGEYNAMMDFMRDDIRTFYFVADAYREARMMGKGKKARQLPPFTAQELFAEYAHKVIGNAAAVKEATEQIYGHCDFLLSCMVAGKENTAWSQNPLYRHLARKFPEVLTTVKQRIFETLVLRKAQSITGGSSASDEKMSAHGQPVHDTEVISIGSTSSTLSPTESSRTRKVRNRSPAETLTGASAIPASLRSTRRGISARESSAKQETESAELTTPIRTHDEKTEDEESLDNDSDSAPPVARKGQSALRPKSNKSFKSNTRQSRGEHDDDEDDDNTVFEPVSSATAAKRKPNEPPNSLRSRKRKYNRADVDEGIDMPSSPVSSDDISGSESEKTPPSAPSDASLASEALRLNHHPDPVQEDTWVCALDGCMHKVYSASKPESQQLIKEHYKLHIYDNDERVKLVKRLQAPSLPIQHLIEKVRLQAAVGEVSNNAGLECYVGPGGVAGSRVAGSRYPDPILRRL